MKTTALLIFIATYAMLLFLPKYRAYVAVIMAIFMVGVGALPFSKVFFALDWNVILMIAGTMGIVSLFIDSKMPSLLADLIIDKTPNMKWAIIALSLFAGLISAFVDNVATVLMVVPIAIIIAKKLNVSPVKAIIAISVSSNLQGAATLVGDTTSILLGGYANLDFFDFFMFQGRIGLFWIVQISAIASTLVLLFVFKNETTPISPLEKTKVTDYFPSALLVSMIALLIVASFFQNKPKITSGVICVCLMFVGIIYNFLYTKKTDGIIRTFKEIDYTTLLLLAGLFIVIAGISEVGIIDDIGKTFVKIGGSNVFVVYTLLVFASVFFSAFIDNIPYVATMLPVTASIAASMGISPYILYFGLLCGATLGGNLTPIGASANITSLGILRREGYEVKASEFMKISVPFTLTAVFVGYVLVWIIFA